MATVANNSFQATEHQINTGSTLLPARWTWTLDNSSHTSNQALSLVESISGVARADGFTTKLTNIRVQYSVGSGTPAPKDVYLYFLSKTSIPATTPVLSADQAFTQSDAYYVLGVVSIATADWIIADKIATVTKTADIAMVNEDTTVSTTVYCFAVNGATTWTPAASSQLGVLAWFEMN